MAVRLCLSTVSGVEGGGASGSGASIATSLATAVVAHLAAALEAVSTALDAVSPAAATLPPSLRRLNRVSGVEGGGAKRARGGVALPVEGRWVAVARDDDASDDSSKELDSPKTRAAKELQARMARLTEEQEAKRREAKMSEPSGLLRSERMCMVQLIVQHDAAQHTVEELGALGSLMFIDLNEGVTAFRRTFLPELRRCDEADRALRFIGDQLAAVGSSPPRASWRSELRVSLPELVSELEDAVKE
ncbi:hypothetical protein EMIHUDRAFT_257680, partial [Emiliania huxleyi CCMP1516]|uniref:V-type proton ATPase subunit a n=2 Tax=Emiliania huxleyi TaxID=2903 RepID=A0A0D3IH34_EMIH1